MEYPFSDQYLKYDYDRHIYVATPKYILEEFGINLSEVLEATDVTNPADLPNIWLRRVSRYVYEYLYSVTFDRDWKEFLLAKDGNWRKFILYWIGEQALYMLNNGDIGLQAGISYEKSNSNDLYQMRGERLYAPLMVQSMKSTKALYLGQSFRTKDIDYEKDGY